MRRAFRHPRDGQDTALGGVLSARQLTKWFGGSQALNNVSVDIEPGRVHAFAGVNGSGKTTLLRILSGQIEPDFGEVVLGEQAQRFRQPSDALAQGIAVVSQERTLVPQLSVAENLFLGRRMLGSAYFIDWRNTDRAAAKVLASVGVAVGKPRRPVGELTPDQQQLVEVARALTTGSKFLLLDEPTSSLSNDEVAQLMDVVRTLKSQGVGVVFVTHRLEEIFAIADIVTVLRDGQVAAHGPASEFDAHSLTMAMLGRAPVPLQAGRSNATAGTLLEVSNLVVKPLVRGVSLSLNEGEIVGIAGLEGSGRSELLAAIYGGTPITSGRVVLNGRQLRSITPSRSVSSGVGYVPPDRKLQGLALENSVADNLLISKDVHRSRIAYANPRHESEIVREAMRKYLIKAASAATPVRTLSGGNQQKVLLGRVLLTEPKVLLLDEPTRGVDVGAKREIYTILDEARKNGVGILLSDGDMEEILQISDRIIVMRRGEIVGEIDAKSASVESLVALAAGHISVESEVRGCDEHLGSVGPDFGP